MMDKVSRHTKLKIISGYALLFFISLFSILLIYQQIIKLSVDETQTNTSRKLVLTGSTITALYEAEALANAFVQTGAQRYFDQYLQIQNDVENNIDSLKELTTDLAQQLRIDSIHFLLEQKVRNLQRLVRVKQSLVPDRFYSKAIAHITSGRDSTAEETGIRTQVVTTLDSTYIKPEKKKKWRLFSKAEPDSVLQITVSHRTIIDSTRALDVQNTDSVVQILQNVWQELQEQSDHVSRQIDRQEYSLIRQSTDITRQLRLVLVAYEQEEIHNTLHKIAQREQVVNATTRIIAWIAVIAFLLILFFIFFILRDLSRSQRYRRELEAANRYADRLLQSREKMILTVTHDIKSPLSSVLGYIELLNDSTVNERQRYYLKNMQGSAEHILKLVGNLLDLSKLENHKMSVEDVTFLPDRLFQEIADNFLPLAKSKQLELITAIDESVRGEFRGDALRIRQIITNILSNAVKYTPRGEIRFAASWDPEQALLKLEVQDSGSGMTAEEQKMIFEEFTRLKSHSAIEGTGLGLTITLKLIHLLDGRLELKSEPGKGSCFIITLPLKKEEAVPGLASAEDSATCPVTTGALDKLKVLLVDDDPLQLEMTSGMLEHRGIHAETTMQPREVIDRLKKEHYNLLISDIQMPGMTGFELIQQIRRCPEFAALPVIALSADAGKEEQDYLQAGFTAYLGKPFSSGQLLALLFRLTGLQGEQGEEPATSHETQPKKKTEGYTLQHILQFTDHDQTALKAILESFVSTTYEHIRLLEGNLEEGQKEAIVRLAHKMLPMFRQLEAEELIEDLQVLEQADKTGVSDEEIAMRTRRVIVAATALVEKLQHHSME